MFAVEHVRRMIGGSQPHLLRCSDDNYYVVKFQNNPQGARILVNEFLGTHLAARLGLPTANAGTCIVEEQMIRLSDEMYVRMPGNSSRRVRCQPGLQFASQFPADPHSGTVLDFLPQELLGSLSNLRDFFGMLVFDKWTGNTDGRQAVFSRS